MEPYKPGQQVWGAMPAPYRLQRLQQKMKSQGLAVPTRRTAIPVRSYNQAVGVRPAPVCGQRAPPPTGKKKALLIGINYFGTPAELKGCINDVHRVRGLINKMFGFPTSPDSMLVLTDDSSDMQFRPLRNNILRGFQWLVDGVQPGDCLFFHYSGHGAQQQDPNYQEEDGYDETICPADFNSAGMIVDDEIFDAIVAPLPSGVKLTAVMDCCHSGTGLDLPFILERGGHWGEIDNPDHSAGDCLLISGCQDKQTSSDGGGDGGKPMGAMTTALCNTLERRRSMTHGELLEGLRGELRSNGFSQLPNLCSSQRFDSNRPFSPTGETIEGNHNPVLGRKHRKKKHPKNPNLLIGGLGDMLMAGAAGFMAGDLMGNEFAQGMLMQGANAIATAAADQIPGLNTEQATGFVDGMVNGGFNNMFGGKPGR